MGDLSGYSLAAVGYVRGLVNAGYEVEWLRVSWPPPDPGSRIEVMGADFPLRNAARNGGGGSLSDMQALIGQSSKPVQAQTIIAHTQPDYWPAIFAGERGRQHIGMTVWETDKPPVYWLPLLDLADAIVVPCRMNRDDFVRAGIRPPVHVVPHIRKHASRQLTQAERDVARNELGLPAGHRVFYTIASWEPRKNMTALIEAFAAAFDGDDPVTLLIKCGVSGYGPGPAFASTPTQNLLGAAIARCVSARTRSLPRIQLLRASFDDCQIDLLHEIGDCYVSMSHAEGWGLGSFDAAAMGNPVIAPAWSAPLDYLAFRDDTWLGAVPVRMTAAPVYPPHLPTYFPSQRWSQPDVAAAAGLLRAFADDPAPMRAEAREIRREICNRFAEPVVMRQLCDLIDA